MSAIRQTWGRLDPWADGFARLGIALGRSGLGDYVACFDALGPRHGDWARHRDRAPERLRPLIDFCLLGRGVAADALPADVDAALAAAEAAGLAERGGGQIVMLGDLAIVPSFGRWLICQAPRAGQYFYFGDDTLALLSRLRPRPGGRCLDLCTGPGALALHAAGIADHVVAVEQLPAPARLARINVALNGLSQRIEVREGDLCEAVTGERFDTVVANPPMLPLPMALPPPALGHAGEDGLAVIVRLLRGLPAALHPDGFAQIIGAALGADMGWIAPLRRAIGHRLDLIVSILSRRCLAGDASYLDAIVHAAGQATGREEGEVRAAYRAMLARSGATGLYHFILHARHGTGRIDLIDVSATNRAEGWRWQR